MSKTAVTFGPVRFSFANVWKPKTVLGGTVAKYSVSSLLSKDNTKAIEQVKAAINAAAAIGIKNGVFTTDEAQRPSFRAPIRDGDEEHADGRRGPEYKGNVFINSSSEGQPGIVDAAGNPIIDPAQFYSGCTGYIHINFFPYNRVGNIGVGAGLQHVMKTEDTDRLDGRISADDAFSSVIQTPEGTDNELI